jgi:hypothetical protein
MVGPLNRRRFLAAAAWLPCLAPAVATAALFPAPGFWTFLASDSTGARCGALSYRFARAPGRYAVSVESVYRLPGPEGRLTVRHGAEELWRDGWLYGLDSRTRVGGRRHRVTLARDDEVLRGTRDGHAFSVSGYVVPSSLWHPETPRLPALLDSVTGRLRTIRGLRGPRERVTLAAAGPAGSGPETRIEATRWRLGGELPRELWYDDGGRLARVRFAAPDGSPVVLERQAD